MAADVRTVILPWEEQPPLGPPLAISAWREFDSGSKLGTLSVENGAARYAGSQGSGWRGNGSSSVARIALSPTWNDQGGTTGNGASLACVFDRSTTSGALCALGGPSSPSGYFYLLQNADGSITAWHDTVANDGGFSVTSPTLSPGAHATVATCLQDGAVRRLTLVIDGRVAATGTQGGGSASTWVNFAVLALRRDTTSGHGIGPVYRAAFGPAIPTAEACRITRDLWGLFEPQTVSVPVSAGGGAGNVGSVFTSGVFGSNVFRRAA